MADYTRIILGKPANKRLTVLCAKLGTTKTVFLDTLSRVPVTKVRELLNTAEPLAQNPNGNQDDTAGRTQ